MSAPKKLLLLLAVVSLSLKVSSQASDENTFLREFHRISSYDIYSLVEKIAAPENKGRLAGTPEYISVAESVAGMLKEWGLTPGGQNGSYLQWFDRPWVEIHNRGELSLLLPQKGGTVITKQYRFPDEAMVGMATGSGELTAEVVFAGYGVTAPELGYDDYRDIDVTGKIVLICRDVPFKDVADSEYSKWVRYCCHQEKLENAVRHGAKGLLYMDGNSANPNITYDPSIIVFGISPAVSDDIFAACGRDAARLIASIGKTMKPASFNTGVRVSMRASSTYHPTGRACNVIGMIPGTNPELKNESIIIGGHLDGVGYIGTDIFPGAWDNATGVACMLAAARALGQSGIKPGRTIIFIFTGGEETGLLGASEYVKNPVLPIEKTVCYINLDMTGNGTGIGIANGLSYPHLMKYFEEANKNFIHRPFSSSEKKPFYGRPRSDSYPFEKAGVRVMAIYTSGAYKQGYYHLPDDKPETITPEVMEDIAKMLYIGLAGIAGE